MNTDRPGGPAVRIVARTPLLRTGLESFADQAGVIVTGAADTALTLRGPDDTTTDSDVEITLDGNQLRLVVRRLPDTATWTAARNLLKVLFDSRSGGDQPASQESARAPSDRW